MRVTVSHNRPKAEAMEAVNRSFDDLFRGIGMVPLRITNEKRSWQGSTLVFSFTARVGLLSAPIQGSVEVKDQEIAVEVDFGWLGRFFPAKQTENVLAGRIRGLLG